ncbi:hypothetical protein [Kushneria aurantia]|uniref:GlsB/YeaQ/YmgE family stress response membrane protein n=1 Tax=Kushneria aurantia TaxID=504092 RepID=A0ABV6FZJ7_9GAMM|nr:hypothetical protein [Kushneria aurantia]
MNLISWIFTSIAVGMLANTVIPRRLSVGYLGSAGMATLGGVVFGFTTTLLGLAAELHFDLHSMTAAAIGALGAVALLTIWMVFHPQHRLR